MKRCVWILILIFALTASAEGLGLTVWLNRADDCYHSDKYCSGGQGERYAVSEAAALDLGFQPCPDCVTLNPYGIEQPEVDLPTVDAEITCAERSGTWVFYFPAALLEVLSMYGGEVPSASAALTEVYGENLTDALEATLALPSGDGLVMSLRVVNGDAWAVVRPKKSFKSKRPLEWAAAHITVDIFNPGVYEVTGVSALQSYKPPSHVHDLNKSYSRKYGDMEVDVYDEYGMRCAVIRTETKSDELTGVIRLGATDVPVTGYVTKGKAVFCVQLTEEEAAMLRDTAPAFIPKDELDTAEDSFKPVATLPPDLFADDSQGE